MFLKLEKIELLCFPVTYGTVTQMQVWISQVKIHWSWPSCEAVLWFASPQEEKVLWAPSLTKIWSEQELKVRHSYICVSVTGSYLWLHNKHKANISPNDITKMNFECCLVRMTWCAALKLLVFKYYKHNVKQYCENQLVLRINFAGDRLGTCSQCPTPRATLRAMNHYLIKFAICRKDAIF